MKDIINLIQMGILNPNSELGASILDEQMGFSFFWCVLFVIVSAFFFWVSGLYKPQYLRHPMDRYRLENKQTFVRAFGWIALFIALYFAYQTLSCFLFPHSVLLENMKEFVE
jgi:hypothetical protein